MRDAVRDAVSVETLDAGYPRHFADLARLCRALGAGADADDIAQDVLVYARAHLGSLREPEKLKPWLRSIAVRKTYQARRNHSARMSKDWIWAPASDPDLRVDLAAAINRLALRERMVLTLVYGLGYSRRLRQRYSGFVEEPSQRRWPIPGPSLPRG
jgi:DNA-directed RNA polymerase specialized sigma24 family protein